MDGKFGLEQAMAKLSPKGGVEMMPFVTDEGVEVDICPVTKGIWLDLGELREFTGMGADLPYFQAAVAASRETIWPSPAAPCRLREIKFHPEYEIVLDYCPQSGGVWLDKGELDKLKELARHLDPRSKAVGVLMRMPAPSSRKPGV